MPEFRALLSGGGVMGERIRAHDWASTPFGAPTAWPQSLRSALSICLNSSAATAICWGPELRLLYNDAWSRMLGPGRPVPLGEKAIKAWADIWHVVGPQVKTVLETGAGYAAVDQLLPIQQRGHTHEAYWNYSFTPIAGEDGSVAGILHQAQETSDRVFADRRNALILALADRMRPLAHPGEILACACRLLGEALGVGRVGYGEVSPDGSTVSVARCWTDGMMADLAGNYRAEDLGKLHRALRQGEICWLEDAATDPGLSARDRATLRRLGLRSGLIAPILVEGRCRAMIFAHDGRPRGWGNHHAALLREVGERLRQELARARAEAALRESERRHRLIFEQAQDVVFTADLNQVITSANPAAAEALGIAAEALVGRSVGEFVAPDTFRRTTGMLRRKLAEGGTTRYEVEVFGKTDLLHWEISSTLTTDGDGHPLGLHAIARDVTERHAFEGRQQMLIEELNHRVKNMLAQVQGIALQSFKGKSDVAEAQAAFQERLAALAAAHDLLTRRKWEGATLTQLVADATCRLAKPDRIGFNGPDVVLPPKATVSLVLALHELATNASRHGALSTPQGRVDIGWRPAGQRLRMEWRESGGPRVAAPEGRGFGLRLIERALASDLGGAVALDFATEGLVCTIDAPLPRAGAGNVVSALL